MDKSLYQIWEAVKSHFAQAETHIPDSLKVQATFKEYRYFLKYNELGLALDCLNLFLEANDFKNKRQTLKHCESAAQLMR